jgi:hypothetical protein
LVNREIAEKCGENLDALMEFVFIPFLFKNSLP